MRENQDFRITEQGTEGGSRKGGGFGKGVKTRRDRYKRESITIIKESGDHGPGGLQVWVQGTKDGI